MWWHNLLNLVPVWSTTKVAENSYVKFSERHTQPQHEILTPVNQQPDTAYIHDGQIETMHFQYIISMQASLKFLSRHMVV